MNPIVGLYESIDAVPLDEWGEVCRTTPTWFLEPRFLRAVERTLPDQARIFHAIVRADGKPAACASLCLYPVDLLSLASPAIRDRAAWVRKLLPGLTQVKDPDVRSPFLRGPKPSGLCAGSRSAAHLGTTRSAAAAAGPAGRCQADRVQGVR